MFVLKSGFRNGCGMLCVLALAITSHAHALNLREAEHLAISSPPPAIVAADARARALREQAGVERALPPPQFIVGLEDLPVDGASAWRMPPGGDGTAVAGVMQMFPSAQRRALQGARILADAGAADANRESIVHGTRLEVRLAYIDAWQAYAAQKLAQRAVAETGMRVEALDAAYRNGRATLADRAGAAVVLALARDSAAEWQQQFAVAQSQLARWIGAKDAINELGFPVLPEPPAEDELLAGLNEHPDVQIAQRELNAREIDADIARAGTKPDFRLETRYGWRGNMPDTASVMLGVDFPLASVGRRRQQVAGALLAVEEGEATREARVRELRADIMADYRRHLLLGQRLAQFDADVVKSTQQRVDASLAGYRSGRDTLDNLIDARIAAVDIDLKRLEMQAEFLRTQARLLYFLPAAPSTPAATISTPASSAPAPAQER